MTTDNAVAMSNYILGRYVVSLRRAVVEGLPMPIGGGDFTIDFIDEKGTAHAFAYTSLSLASAFIKHCNEIDGERGVVLAGPNWYGA